MPKYSKKNSLNYTTLSQFMAFEGIYASRLKHEFKTWFKPLPAKPG